MALLALITTFSAFNALAYEIYLKRFRDVPRDGPVAPGRVTGLLLLDLLQVGISASLFAGLLVVNPLEMFHGGLAAVAARLPLRPRLWYMILGLLAFWHLAIYAWYRTWPGTSQNEYESRAGRAHRNLIGLYGLGALSVLALWLWSGDFAGRTVGGVVDVGGLLVLVAGVVYHSRSILYRTFRAEGDG